MQALGHTHGHALVVGGVEFDHVEPAALGIEGPEPRRVLIGKPAPLEGRGAAAGRPKDFESLHRSAAALAGDGLDEDAVGAEQVHVLEWWALIQNLVSR